MKKEINESEELSIIITRALERVEKLVPFYMQIEEDRLKANGNVAICIMDERGQVYGRLFGSDKIRARESYRVAWTKASQVWITGIKTGEFEKLAFNKEIDEEQFGIKRPDYIGWEGGQPVSLADGTVLFVGFSGFRSATDIEIILKAFAGAEELIHVNN